MADEGKVAAVGTKKDDFQGVLQAEYDEVEWPKSYAMTTDQLWQKLGGGEVVLSKGDATSMVRIWNVCAWSLQLVDDTKAGRDTKTTIDSLTSNANGDTKQFVDPILSDARLGGLAAANKFIKANDCKDGFA